MTAPVRYSLVHDNSGHTYVVPDSLRTNFYDWLACSDYCDDDAPDYAERVDGRLTFTDPRVE